MFSVIIVIHLIVAISLVGIILLQRSEGGGLGVSGGGNMGAQAPRGKADAITKTTGILAGLFIVTSLTLVIIMARGVGGTSSLVDQLSASTPAQNPGGAPAEAPVVPEPTSPDQAPAPVVPLSK